MVPVYDAVNKERLLGYHPRWSQSEPYRRFMCAQNLGPVCAYGPDELPDISINIHTVEFRRDYRYSDNGWKAETILTTYAPLEHLLMLRDFLLPGETPDQAYRRRHWYY